MALGRRALATPNFILCQTRLGVWEIRWTEGKRTKTKSTRTKVRSEADTALKRHVAEWHAPKLPADPLISDLIKAYRRDHIPHIVSQRTASEALDKVETKLGVYRPKELTDTVMREYAAWRKAQPRWGRQGAGNVSNGTVAREVNALRGVLGWAARNHQIAQPVAVRTPVQTDSVRERFLSHDEVAALLKAANAAPHLALFIRIALATAARKSAILQMRWDQVGWPQSKDPLEWRISPGNEYEYEALVDTLTLNLGRGVGNKHRAIVPVGNNAPLYKALKRAHKAAKSDHVIEYRGKPVVDVVTALENACQRGGIRQFGTHTLKHTSISWMVMRGIPFGVISKMSGTSVATLEKHYAHLSPEMAGHVGDMFAM